MCISETNEYRLTIMFKNKILMSVYVKLSILNTLFSESNQEECIS